MIGDSELTIKVIQSSKQRKEEKVRDPRYLAGKRWVLVKQCGCLIVNKSMGNYIN